MSDATINFEPSCINDYRTFLKVKQLPRYSFQGRTAVVPAEYANMIGVNVGPSNISSYEPNGRLWDYQRNIAKLAIAKQKFAVFADCGLGKTLIMLEFARHAARVLPGRKTLIVSPLMVVEQTIGESVWFYGESIDHVPSSQLSQWLNGQSGRIGITNYEALRNEVPQGQLGCLILDESSMLKSHYGKYGQECIRLGKGLPFKLAGTGTPAPNDRIEYANHALFLDQFPTVNAFLARFFVNRGQTKNRWELKPHAIEPFYRHLSHWSIFLTQPATYGWKDNSGELPPIHVHIHNVDLTDQQRDAMHEDLGMLIVVGAGGIGTRSKLSQLAKGWRGKEKIDTKKPTFISDLLNQWPNESTIIWCLYNREQEAIANLLPDAANISGDTPHDVRMRLIGDFKSGRRKVLISKPKIMGFGLNLQIATRMIFSGLQDSYEQFYQAVKRANRYGSTQPLNVHIPVTEIEVPMVETVLRKADRVQKDAEEQERIFSHARQWK